MRVSKKAAPYLFISPFYILFLIFGTFPIIYSLFLSFQLWDGMGTMEFVGLANYKFVLQDPWFRQSLWNTFILLILTTIPQHTMALFFAYVLNNLKVKFKEFFRASYFLPYITSAVAVTLVFEIFYGKNAGILNLLLKYIGKFPPIGFLFDLINLNIPIDWVGKAFWLRPAIALMVNWKWTGWQMIIYYAALQNIPETLYEAAKVDGANMRQTFFKITLPILRPIIFYGITMSIIGNLRLFAEPSVLTNGTGGVGRSGLTTAMFIYKCGFEWGDFGAGSAAAYILCAIIIFFTIVNKKLFQE